MSLSILKPVQSRGTYLAHLAWLRAWQSSWYLNSCSGMTLLTANFNFCRGSLKRSSWREEYIWRFFFSPKYNKTYSISRTSIGKNHILYTEYRPEMLSNMIFLLQPWLVKGTLEEKLDWLCFPLHQAETQFLPASPVTVFLHILKNESKFWSINFMNEL